MGVPKMNTGFLVVVLLACFPIIIVMIFFPLHTTSPKLPRKLGPDYYFPMTSFSSLKDDPPVPTTTTEAPLSSTSMDNHIFHSPKGDYSWTCPKPVCICKSVACPVVVCPVVDCPVVASPAPCPVVASPAPSPKRAPEIGSSLWYIIVFFGVATYLVIAFLVAMVYPKGLVNFEKDLKELWKKFIKSEVWFAIFVKHAMFILYVVGLCILLVLLMNCLCAPVVDYLETGGVREIPDSEHVESVVITFRDLLHRG